MLKETTPSVSRDFFMNKGSRAMLLLQGLFDGIVTISLSLS